MCLGLLTCVASAAGFPFADVPIYEWYFNDVKNAYDMDLINGKTINMFAPNDYLTYAEAVKLAACMNQRYTTGAVSSPMRPVSPSSVIRLALSSRQQSL